MKVQRVRLPESERVSWLVLGDDYLPIEPIWQFLRYVETLGSPFTVRTYAYHLLLFWRFLVAEELDWLQIRLSHLADFVHWLRLPAPESASPERQVARRHETSINAIMNGVTSFYEFHHRDRADLDLPLYREAFMPNRRYKNFLYHISKRKPMRLRLVQLKAAPRPTGTLSPEQVGQLIAACRRSRDKFLLCLLYDTGMRIGQALGLRHADIVSWDNVVNIIPRADNANGARAKAREPYTVHVAARLMRLYSDYLVDEFGETDSDYVFVNLWAGRRGSPMTYANVVDLCRRLSRRTGIPVHPHMFRHTHATELGDDGWDTALIQRRLGHASIASTTKYTHPSDRRLKEAHAAFGMKREGQARW